MSYNDDSSVCPSAKQQATEHSSDLCSEAITTVAVIRAILAAAWDKATAMAPLAGLEVLKAWMIPATVLGPRVARARVVVTATE